ncbi:MAG: glucose 1-dehydrogenase [Hyphomicrobiaceae bacterium]|nr:glucose 1-dehydrogenase [Hyphomicrobiaceae bacterium]
MRGLAGRHAIVTGGASGIGRALCKRLGEEGCIVSIFDLNLAGAEETVEAISSAGGRGGAFEVDIASLDSVRAGVAASEEQHGPTDILINNAGWDRIVPFLKSEPELWKKVVDINLYGPLNMHYAVLPGMTERGRGRVVNISSDAGRVGSSGEAVYSAAKGGIISFTKTMARELARSGIRLNTVCPGPTDTPLFAEVAGDGEVGQKIAEGLRRAIPLKRLAAPEDYPGIVAFLASDDAGFITGQTISVSGGLTMHG